MSCRWVVACLLCITQMASSAEFLDLRHSVNQDSSRVVLEFSEAPSFRALTLAEPDRLVIDLPNVSALEIPGQGLKDDSRIIQLRASARGTGTRLVVDLAGPYRTGVFALPPQDRYPHRLVVDVIGYVAGEPNRREAATEAPEPPAERRDIVIAIDPGHGGKDPGASGYGVVEKEIVLQISKRLAKRINQEPGFRAVLTRPDDRFIPLADRPKLAREAGADFFISVHADSFPKNRDVRGFGVYALSLRGANSELSRWLQNTENAEDLAGGVDLGNVDDQTRQVLLNMSMESATRISKQAGERLLTDLRRIGRVHKQALGLANFVVLRSPDIPSLLVETGFLSNRTDAKRLADPNEQVRVADAIAAGIVDYFERSPPANTLVYWQKQQGDPISITVAPGDSLSVLAARHGVRVQDIKQLNGLTSDVIRVGQQLEVPLGAR